MLVVKCLVLQLKVLKLFVLAIRVALEQLGEVVHPLTDLLMQFLELSFRAFFEFLELHLQFALLLALVLQRFLEVIDCDLANKVCTSISSTCYFTVVVKPSLESVLPARDIMRSLRLELVRIAIKLF